MRGLHTQGAAEHDRPVPPPQARGDLRSWGQGQPTLHGPGRMAGLGRKLDRQPDR